MKCPRNARGNAHRNGNSLIETMSKFPNDHTAMIDGKRLCFRTDRAL